MKGVILHGGKGTRLRPLTHTGPKQLIKIAGKPISQWGVEGLRDHGITDIAIILGDNNPTKVIDHYGDGSSLGVNITYIYQGMAKGLAHAISLVRDFVGNETFIVYLGDNVVLDGLDKLVKFTSDASILLAPVETPERYGVAVVDGNKITRLVEKPKELISKLALVGVYGFTSSIFDSIDGLKPSARGELEITEAIQNLIDRGLTVEYSKIEGWWKDTGTPADLLDANVKLLDRFSSRIIKSEVKESKLEGRIIAESGSKIENSTIIGPAYIGKNTVILDSFIGPFTSIGDSCEIHNAEIRNSLVFDESSTSDVNISDSIIGYRARTSRNDIKPNASKIIVGEGTVISI